MTSASHAGLGRNLGQACLWLLLAVAACGPRVYLPLELTLSTHDLPPNFHPGATSIEEIEGGISYGGDFYASSDPSQVYILVKHELAVYPGSSEAAAYATRANEYFPPAYWEEVESFRFRPRDPGDRFRFACMPVKINRVPITSCGYLQQHSRFISLVLVNTDGKAITIAQLEHAIDRLDERFFNYRQPLE
jgi:hypothetical protein